METVMNTFICDNCGKRVDFSPQTRQTVLQDWILTVSASQQVAPKHFCSAACIIDHYNQREIHMMQVQEEFEEQQEAEKKRQEEAAKGQLNKDLSDEGISVEDTPNA